MVMKPEQLFRRTKHGIAVAPIDVNNTTVNGPAINQPWLVGTELRFLLSGGVWAATTNLSAVVQVQQRSDSSWVALTNKDSTTVQFLPTALDDAGAGEGATLSGTIDLTYIDGTLYKAVRLSIANSAAVSALVAATYEIYGLFEMVGGDSANLDHLWNLQKAL